MFRGTLQQSDTSEAISRRPVDPFATGFLEPPKMNFLRAAISPDQRVMRDRGADPFCRFSQSKHGGRPRDRR